MNSFVYNQEVTLIYLIQVHYEVLSIQTNYILKEYVVLNNFATESLMEFNFIYEKMINFYHEKINNFQP